MRASVVALPTALPVNVTVADDVTVATDDLDIRTYRTVLLLISAAIDEPKTLATAEFTVDSAFGSPGAITVTNKHQKEFFLESITIEGFACGPVHFPCNSWVQSQKDHPSKKNQKYEKLP